MPMAIVARDGMAVVHVATPESRVGAGDPAAVDGRIDGHAEQHHQARQQTSDDPTALTAPVEKHHRDDQCRQADDRVGVDLRPVVVDAGDDVPAEDGARSHDEHEAGAHGEQVPVQDPEVGCHGPAAAHGLVLIHPCTPRRS